MEIYSKELGPAATNVFVVWNKTTKEAVVIDAPQGAYDVVQQVVKGNNLKLVALLLTHGHWDHIMEASKFQKDGLKTYGHEGDTVFYDNPMIMSVAMPMKFNLEAVKIDYWVNDGDQIDLLGQSIEVRHVPGHAPGNILFYFREHNEMFSGDVIFAGSIGRYDFPGCSFEELEKSIKERIYTLPDDAIIYPGHGPDTTVGYEKKHNPYVKA